MKLFIISIAAFYALAFTDCTTNEYCFKNENPFVRLEMIRREGECYIEEVGDMTKKYYYRKEEKVSLSEEYKFCRWVSGIIKAKVNLDGNLTLSTGFGFLETSTGRQTKRKEYDSVVINDISDFDCYLGNGLSSEIKCLEKKEEEIFKGENEKYNELILPILKKSIGKTFTADIAVNVSCPRDANDTNYAERKTLKISRPIIVTGECLKSAMPIEKADERKLENY